jgi:hypothetical protein
MSVESRGSPVTTLRGQGDGWPWSRATYDETTTRRRRDDDETTHDDGDA